MLKSYADFFRPAQIFIEAFDRLPNKLIENIKSDHISYKCNDRIEFETIRDYFENESQYIYQSFISERRIAVIKLIQPLKTNAGEIWYLELADQKLDGSQTSGFDHMEVFPLGVEIADVVQRFLDEGATLKRVERPHHTTYDHLLTAGFKVRIETEPLINKIKTTEMI